MAANFLKQYYLDDNKLRQRALLEFRRAHATGRMIAFTGAMTTEIFGFGSWRDLQLKITDIAERQIDPAKNSVSTLIRELFEAGKIKDARVAFSILGEAVDQSKKGGNASVEREIAEHFAHPDLTKYGLQGGLEAIKPLSVPYALIHEAGITRFATLNYDLELERVGMFSSMLQRDDMGGLACCRFDGHQDRLIHATPASRSKSMGLL